MLKLKFDWRDVVRAPRLALSLQRMWIQLVGMSVGYLVYLALSYLSLIVAGYEFKVAWSQFGLLPCLFGIGDSFPWISWLLFGLGSLFFFVTFLVTNTAVSRAVYMTSKGNSFYSWREAFAFSFRKLGSVVLAPLALLLLIGLLILGAAVVGLLGKIPFVGEIGVSLFTLVWILSALLIFFLVLVTFVTVILVPSIIATTDEDAFEAIFQSFSIAWSQPWRFLFYEVVTVVASFLALAGLAFFIKEAVFILNALLGSFMGADFINLANNGQALLQSWILLAENVFQRLYGDYVSYFFFSKQFVPIPGAELPISVTISSYIYALNLLFIGGWVISYAISTFTAGTTISFLVLKYKKDEENLLERQDNEEEIEDDTLDEESSKADEQTDDEEKK
ncbi:hypothetical protein EH223_16695 [candidate division KSB1 bacterium]|nr:hypothetical protein [candidate division KSB1 bacterium]RQW00985.1 MAG: hypothetical protein EH223_16695 [candidate division KSB1 bacterium]